MHKKLSKYCLVFLFAFVTLNSYSQTGNETVNVFLDCRGCSERFIQTEIEFVKFVRDQEDADVHIFIINQRTGSGGVEYTIEFLGQGAYQDKDQTLKVISPESDTQEERRNKLVAHIKLGLVSYLFDKNVVSRLNLSFDKSNQIALPTTPERDPWNSWIFEIGGNTNFNGEESQNRVNINSYVSADRVTEEWKFESGYRFNSNRRTVFTDEEREIAPGDTAIVEVKNVYIRENHNFFALLVKSLGDHWAAGLWTTARASTQDNIDLRLAVAPAIEYSVFPYREFTRRQLVGRYELTLASLDYTETTIFNKDKELLIQHQFVIDAEFTQPWGGIEGRVNAEAFMHDLTKNNLSFNAQIDFRVFRGLSVFISGRYSLINDQLWLPAGNITEEELLLNLRNQATSYSFGGSIGLEFTFGSIYNNVINPRL